MTPTLFSANFVLPRHEAGLSLEHNPHKTMYETVEQWAEKFNDDVWVSSMEQRRAIDTNELWYLHWYPDTPVGYCQVVASTLDAVLKAACPDNS